jgi:hypothetical protein
MSDNAQPAENVTEERGGTPVTVDAPTMKQEILTAKQEVDEPQEQGQVRKKPQTKGDMTKTGGGGGGDVQKNRESEGGKGNNPLRLRLDLELDIDIRLTAKINGSVQLSLL